MIKPKKISKYFVSYVANTSDGNGLNVGNFVLRTFANGEELGKEAVKAANSLKEGATVMSISKIG